jgi:hypothetical protein
VPGIVVYDVAADGAVLFARGDSLFTAPAWTAIAYSVSRTGFVVPEADPWGHQLRPDGDWVGYTAMNQERER